MLSKKAFTNCRHPELDSESSRLIKQGFTLVELLVVILIIGILAAVAVPQYKRAVWRSRNAQLKAMVKAVAQAERVYYLANGQYAGNFNELDVDLPLEKPVTQGTATSYSTASNVCHLATMGSDAIRRGDGFDVILNTGNLKSNVTIVGVWTKGPYPCTGFRFSFSVKEMRCAENGPNYGGIQNPQDFGSFCEKVEGAVLTETSEWGERYYNLK